LGLPRLIVKEAHYGYAAACSRIWFRAFASLIFSAASVTLVVCG
jgi:hypothetical protein